MVNRKKSVIVMWLACLIILGGSTGDAWARLAPGNIPQAQQTQDDEVTVSLTSLPASVSGCGVLDLYIDVNAVSNLYGVDVRMSFDPEVIEVVDFTPLSARVTIEPVVDPNLNFVADWTLRNEVDNFRGTLWYAANSLSPTPAAAGSGHVAHLQVRAKSNGDPDFKFTYIKLANQGSGEIPATGGLAGTLTASTDVIPDVDIIRLDKDTVQLQWLAGPAAKVSSYKVYRSATPYFYAQGTPYQTITNPGSGALSLDDAVLGNVATNYFYALRAVCSPATGGGESAASNQVGKFEYQLYETATTDFNWVGLVLDATPAWTNAKNIADHISLNSNGTVAVKSISEWNNNAQSYNSYLVFLPFANNFAVSLRKVYRAEIDIDQVSSGSVIWAQVGRLPALESDTYTLLETARTDFNWVLQPLDMTGVSKARSLADNIILNSSAPVSVPSISVWNGSAQSYTTYLRTYHLPNFDTRFGYPYRVEADVNSGYSVTWP